MEQRETELREVIRVRYVAFWEETDIHEFNLLKMLEDRDKSLKETLKSRDREWLNSLQHCRDSLRLNTPELMNNRALMEILSKRQRELTKGNAEILDWVMKTFSGKKKVPLPHIRISHYIPYTIVPRDEQNPPKLFTNPDKGELPFTPCRVLPQDETYGTIKMSIMTPEEIEEYLKKKATKEKPPRPKEKTSNETKKN